MPRSPDEKVIDTNFLKIPDILAQVVFNFPYSPLSLLSHYWSFFFFLNLFIPGHAFTFVSLLPLFMSFLPLDFLSISAVKAQCHLFHKIFFITPVILIN